MVAVTVDSAVRSKLSGAQAQIEIRDESGVLLGYFTPAWLGTAEDYRRAREHFDPAEIQRRKQSNEPGVTTRELMEHLNSLGPA